MNKKKVLIASVVATSVAVISTVAGLFVYTLHSIDNINFDSLLTD